MSKKRDFGVLSIVLVAVIFLGFGVMAGFYYFSDGVKLAPVMTPDIYGHSANELNVNIPDEGDMTLQDAINEGKIGGTPQSFFGITRQSINNMNGTYTWAVPQGVNKMIVEVVGGGGGGGIVGVYHNGAGGGGGGAGAYSRTTLEVSPGTVYTLSVGQGGKPGYGGEDSVLSLNGHNLVLAKGGAAGHYGGGSVTDGAGGEGGAASGGIGDFKVNGNSGSAGSGLVGGSPKPIGGIGGLALTDIGISAAGGGGMGQGYNIVDKVAAPGYPGAIVISWMIS